MRGGHVNQRRGVASQSAPSRARRARMVHRRAAVGGWDGWRREGEGHCTLKDFFFETHAERIDLDGFKFFVLVGLDATNFILSLD